MANCHSNTTALNMTKTVMDLPYFFGCKTEVFLFQNNPKDLDPSFKMDLDPCDCLGRVKLVFHMTDLVI